MSTVKLSQTPPSTLPAFDLFGIRVNAITKWDLIDITGAAIEQKKRCIIANHNLHSLYLWHREARMRDFYSLAQYTNVDGMSLVFLGRLIGLPLKTEHRTNYIDLLEPFVEQAARKRWKIFYLGSKPGVAEHATQILRDRYINLQIEARHGYFKAEDVDENQKILDEISRYCPNVLMVGMGMPRQEIWVAKNIAKLSADVIFCCGGLMDLVAGEIPTAPRWLGSMGLEWVFRLFSEPRRLWRRYLVEPWFILGHISFWLLRRIVGLRG